MKIVYDKGIIKIYGDNRFETYAKVRYASRGILFSGSEILLTHEDNGQYFIPGGGAEPLGDPCANSEPMIMVSGDNIYEAEAGEDEYESPEDCCERELAEETGILVDADMQFLIIEEYYEEWKYISWYYICRYKGRTGRSLTEREREAGLEPVWVDINEALEIFSHHADHDGNTVLDDSDEMRRGAYLREYTALKYLVESDLYQVMKRRDYRSEYAEVRFLPRYNVVLVTWKRFCQGNDYREPLELALGFINWYKCDYCADTRSGFEDAPEDTRWVAEYFMPKAAEYGCRTIYFIIDKENSLKDELEGQRNDSADIMRFEYIYDIYDIENISRYS